MSAPKHRAPSALRRLADDAVKAAEEMRAELAQERADYEADRVRWVDERNALRATIDEQAAALRTLASERESLDARLEAFTLRVERLRKRVVVQRELIAELAAIIEDEDDDAPEDEGEAKP